jgi:monovalent cation/proton antiporter MnhG/PhaG subunit
VRDVAVAALLVVGVACILLSCVGVLAMRGVYDRLHFSSLSTLGAVALAVAVTVREPLSLIGNKALLLVVFFLVTSPILVHVTSRAARIREHGDVHVQTGELEVEEP